MKSPNLPTSYDHFHGHPSTTPGIIRFEKQWLFLVDTTPENPRMACPTTAVHVPFERNRKYESVDIQNPNQFRGFPVSAGTPDKSVVLGRVTAPWFPPPPEFRLG